MKVKTYKLNIFAANYVDDQAFEKIIDIIKENLENIVTNQNIAAEIVECNDDKNTDAAPEFPRIPQRHPWKPYPCPPSYPEKEFKWDNFGDTPDSWRNQPTAIQMDRPDRPDKNNLSHIVS